MKMKKLSPPAKELEDKLIRLSKTTKVRPKQVKSIDIWQYTDFRQVNEMFENSPKSTGYDKIKYWQAPKNDKESALVVLGLK